MNKLLPLILLTSFSYCSVYAQSKHERIKSNLKDLSVLIGEWEVSSENISHSGKRSEEKGTYIFSWALDSTYITREGSFTNIASNRTRKFISWLTYDQTEDKFRMVFFYNRRANMITEYGTYDEENQTFTTFTSFEIEDGRTEYIRHVVELKNPERIVGRSWIRLDDAEEANNFTTIWTRK